MTDNESNGRRSLFLHGAAVAASLLAIPASGEEAPTWADAGRLFANRCVLCHSGEDAPLDLRLDSYEGSRKGSYNGRIAIAGKPAESEIIRRVRGKAKPAMPLVGDPLPESEIVLLERWIVSGMPEGGGEPALAASAPAEPPLEGPLTYLAVERIFLQNCAVCHSGNSKIGAPPEGLQLDSYVNVIRGGERLALIPGNPAASEILRRIEGRAEPRMPYKRPPLAADQIQQIRDWIAAGAHDSSGTAPPSLAGRKVRYRGRMTGPREIDGIPFTFSGESEDLPGEGELAEMRGTVEGDGSIRATRLRAR